jgi:DNA repair protein RadC
MTMTTDENLTYENRERVAKSMHDLTDDEKPREKALKQGMNSLSDVELLAILLGSGIPGKSVLDLSREILKDNDNRLAYLSRKSIPELVRKYKGMGTAKATLLVAAMTFGARTQSDLQIRDPQMTTSEVVYNYMRSRLERLNNEEFWVLHLSRSNRVQSVEQISKGGLTQTSVDVKLIGKSIIDRLSAGVILCHNHPSGNLVASSADDAITRKIVEVCKLLDVSVLDHLIIGPTGYYSYRDEGKL